MPIDRSPYDTREIVHLVLIIVLLNDLEVKAADILNTYMMAPNREFRNNAGKAVIVVRVLCGLKSAGALFRAHLAQYMQELGLSVAMLTLTHG